MTNQIKLSQLSEALREDYFERHKDKRVTIHSDHGIWRAEGKGYTDKPDEAGVFTLREAYECTKHCGPEKKVSYRCVGTNV